MEQIHYPSSSIMECKTYIYKLTNEELHHPFIVEVIEKTIELLSNQWVKRKPYSIYALQKTWMDKKYPDKSERMFLLASCIDSMRDTFEYPNQFPKWKVDQLVNS